MTAARTGGAPRRISREEIVRAALELAEAHGLDSVSMRGVARSLGVTPMALYHHVGDKRALLDAVVEELLSELPVPDPSLPWSQRLQMLADELRAVARRHPAAFLTLFQRPAVTEPALARRNAVYTALRDAGVPEDLVPRVERLLSTFVIGFAASEASGRWGHRSKAQADEDLHWLEQTVTSLLEQHEPR